MRATYDGSGSGRPEPILTGIPQRLHPRRRPAGVRAGRLPLRLHRRDRRARARPGPRLARRQDPADHPRRRARRPATPTRTARLDVGHRNVQGLAFDDAGQLWASEFGQDTFDELNRIDTGANYGWPVVEGTGGARRLHRPAGHVAHRRRLPLRAGLRRRAPLDGRRCAASGSGGSRSTGEGRPTRGVLRRRYGRMRTVVVAPDGNLWVTTCNRDGRGDPAADDDQILMRHGPTGPLVSRPRRHGVPRCPPDGWLTGRVGLPGYPGKPDRSGRCTRPRSSTDRPRSLRGSDHGGPLWRPGAAWPARPARAPRSRPRW